MVRTSLGDGCGRARASLPQVPPRPRAMGSALFRAPHPTEATKQPCLTANGDDPGKTELHYKQCSGD
eukprot:15449111-Alexandrium_andersonii.AAC.1